MENSERRSPTFDLNSTEFVSEFGRSAIDEKVIERATSYLEASPVGLLADRHASGEKPITYRCPTSYVLNPYTRSPFVPWPDFQDGESLELAKAVAAFWVEAEAGS